MEKTREQIHKDFEDFRDWVDDVGLCPVCIWCRKAEFIYGAHKKRDDALEAMKLMCFDCKFRKVEG
jgi:hypothetical protein